jgi:HK97 gp10 family phage protein
MADSVRVRLEGVDQLRAALKDAAQTIRTRAVRGALRKAALVIRNAAKARAPVLQVATPRRKAGTVRNRISVRPSKFARQAGNEGVFVGVKPLRGKVDLRRFGKAGANNPNDPFYWRFLEFGTRKMRARPFLGPAASQRGGEAVQVFMREVVPQINRLNSRASKARAR